MDDHEHKDENYFDPWSIFSPTERESIENIEDEDHLFERLNEQREAALERLWATFQGAAASLAQLYKGKEIFHSVNELSYFSYCIPIHKAYLAKASSLQVKHTNDTHFVIKVKGKR